MELDTVTIIPQPGDLIFTEGNLVIEAWQRLKRIPHPEKTHVVIMVGSDHLIEATKGELVSIRSYQDWINERDSRIYPKDRKRVILRPKGLELSEYINQLYNRAAYHNGKEYALSSAFEKNNAADTAICSSLALDLLVESSIIPSIEVIKNRYIYPGELYEKLINNGFSEIDIHEWEKGGRSHFGVVDARGHVEIRNLQEKLLEANADFLRRLPNYPDTAALTSEYFCTWFYKLEHEGSIFDYLLFQINLAAQLYDTHFFYRDLGPANYRDVPQNKRSMDEDIRHIKSLERFILGLAYQLLRLCSNLLPFTVESERIECRKYDPEEIRMEEFRKEYLKRAFWAYSLTGKLGDEISIPAFEIVGISGRKEFNQSTSEDLSNKIEFWQKIYNACSDSIAFLTQPINWRLEILRIHFGDSVEDELENDCQQFLEYFAKSDSFPKY